MLDEFQSKIILITGGAGSIGRRLVKKLLEYKPEAIRVFDNDEAGLFNLEQKLSSDRLRLFVGDVRDKERLKRAMENVNIIFHAAALKHVPICEYNPFEAVQTNVVGTQNVIDAALDADVDKMIKISTDKAVAPINVMGATKLTAERLTTTANFCKGVKKTALSSVRFGNVLNSAGSVIPIFKEQIKKGGPITITSQEMTRFFMAFPQAINLILRACQLMKGGEIFTLKMPALKIIDLADVLIEELAPRYGHDLQSIKLKMIGVRPGEKIHESLITREEAGYISETEQMFIIYNPLYRANQKSDISRFNYTSGNMPLLSKAQIKKLLYKGNVI